MPKSDLTYKEAVESGVLRDDVLALALGPRRRDGARRRAARRARQSGDEVRAIVRKTKFIRR